IKPTLKGSAWPLVAPSPLRGTNQLMAVDLWSATARLATALEFPATTGEIANRRAAHFEVEIQHVIDRSAWKPPDAIRQMRGRTLRLAGKDITDIDAIGEQNTTVLLVSAKSKVYGALYDTGDYAQIRNAATAIDEAVSYWREILSVLSAHPKGDNY